MSVIQDILNKYERNENSSDLDFSTLLKIDNSNNATDSQKKVYEDLRDVLLAIQNFINPLINICEEAITVDYQIFNDLRKPVYDLIPEEIKENKEKYGIINSESIRFYGILRIGDTYMLLYYFNPKCVAYIRVYMPNPSRIKIMTLNIKHIDDRGTDTINLKGKIPDTGYDKLRMEINKIRHVGDRYLNYSKDNDPLNNFIGKLKNFIDITSDSLSKSLEPILMDNKTMDMMKKILIPADI